MAISSVKDIVKQSYSPDRQVDSMYVNISPLNKYNLIKMDLKMVKVYPETGKYT